MCWKLRGTAEDVRRSSSPRPIRCMEDLRTLERLNEKPDTSSAISQWGTRIPAFRFSFALRLLERGCRPIRQGLSPDLWSSDGRVPNELHLWAEAVWQ